METTIEDITGKKMAALTIFRMAIKHLKDHLMSTINDRTVGLTIDDVYFVLTVPAIWNDSAKWFMREAAEQAEISKDSLTLALESEAASVYYQVNPTHISVDKDTKLWRAGTTYMVIDLGGGTVDITCHEKQIEGTLKEVYKASGGSWGGSNVNQNFIALLTKIFGQPLMEQFKREEMGDYFELLREFEVKKREISALNDGIEFIRMPVSFKEIYERMHGKTVQTAISQSEFKNDMTWERDKIKIQANCLRLLFNSSINPIIEHIQSIIRELTVSISHILLVGGFAECKIVQNAVKTNFSEILITIPHDAGLAVLKGAVCYGQKPCISSRILQFTYGVERNPTFDPVKHPLSKKYIDKEGVARCENYFEIIKRVKKSVSVGEVEYRKSQPTLAEHRTVAINIFTSTEQSPTLTTESSCKKRGSFNVDLPPYTGEDRNIEERYIFGETELLVEAIEPKSGKKYEMYLDLL